MLNKYENTKIPLFKGSVSDTEQPQSSFLEKKVFIQKKHRNHTPVIRKNSKFALGKELSAIVNIHDWNRNRYLLKLRKNKKQRLSIRSERRETLYALVNELIEYADYSIDSDYLFEVMTNVERLAQNIRQLHIYPSGRKSYDPVIKALRMLEEAGLIIILREMDHQTKQRKAMRIWLRPEFFYSFGFSKKRLKQKVKNLYKYRVKKGLLEKSKNMYREHISRLAYSNVADITDKFALKNLLINIKKDFLSQEVIDNIQKTPEKSCSYKKSTNDFSYDIRKMTDDEQRLISENIKKLRAILNSEK
ncbi:IncFII RepA protein family [Phocoenobacter uteri]|uniref:IncFII RepA protein family n=1 Tax=Phocoenobacter uteri TaxID=146806 RepID=A0A379DFQ2_9PAST|nr:hypothetical protein [Phocoenobacter uteri]MDG6882840.1 hypothetical protein [Phocoenobacter uteri]SUB76415.1 IncFII RepA protein family [Phocoenobacter uteri]